MTNHHTRSVVDAAWEVQRSWTEFILSFTKTALNLASAVFRLNAEFLLALPDAVIGSWGNPRPSVEKLLQSDTNKMQLSSYKELQLREVQLTSTLIDVADVSPSTSTSSGDDAAVGASITLTSHPDATRREGSLRNETAYASLSSRDSSPTEGSFMAVIEIHTRTRGVLKFPSDIAFEGDASVTRNRNNILGNLRGLLSDYMVDEGVYNSTGKAVVDANGNPVSVRRPSGSRQVDFYEGDTVEGHRVLIPAAEIVEVRIIP